MELHVVPPRVQEPLPLTHCLLHPDQAATRQQQCKEQRSSCNSIMMRCIPTSDNVCCAFERGVHVRQPRGSLQAVTNVQVRPEQQNHTLAQLQQAPLGVMTNMHTVQTVCINTCAILQIVTPVPQVKPTNSLTSASAAAHPQTTPLPQSSASTQGPLQQPYSQRNAPECSACSAT